MSARGDHRSRLARPTPDGRDCDPREARAAVGVGPAVVALRAARAVGTADPDPAAVPDGHGRYHSVSAVRPARPPAATAPTTPGTGARRSGATRRRRPSRGGGRSTARPEAQAQPDAHGGTRATADGRPRRSARPSPEGLPPNQDGPGRGRPGSSGGRAGRPAADAGLRGRVPLPGAARPGRSAGRRRGPGASRPGRMPTLPPNTRHRCSPVGPAAPGRQAPGPFTPSTPPQRPGRPPLPDRRGGTPQS